MFKFYISIFFLFFFNLSAEIIQKLEVKGNSRISVETIRVYGEITLGNEYSNFELNEVLKNLYKTEFFEDIQLSLTNGTLNITVEEYPIINSIIFEGEKSNKVKKSVMEKLNLREKQSFIESKLSQDITLIKKIYATIGFNFADVEPKIQKFDNNLVNLVYILDKGKKTDISEINFIGDKKVKDKRLRDVIVSEENKFWKFLSKNTYLNYNNVELDKRLLINYYKSLGYYDVQVLSSNAEISKDNLTTLTYTINAGVRYKITKISTDVSNVLDKKLFIPMQDLYVKNIGKYYSPFLVKKLLDRLDLLIVNNDLQFIEHSVNEILDGDEIEIKINVYEGSKQLVERIDVLGNSVTDEAVIRAELLIDEGDPFNKLKFEKSIAKLKARNLFGEVKYKIQDGTSSDLKLVQIQVEEKPTGEITAGAGIGTSGGSFAFSISENNWLGKGINLATSLDVSAETLSGTLIVTDPNYNFSGNTLKYFVQNTSNDKPDSGFKNNITTTGIGTKFEQYNNIYLSPGLAVSYDDLQVESTASDALKKQKGTFTDLSFDYGISADKRDRVYAPTDGYFTRFSQVLPLYSDTPALGTTYVLNTYKPMSPDVIGSFKLFATAITGLNDEDVRISKRAMLPSSKLRGFKPGKVGPKDGNDYIGGNYALATNFEANLPNFLPESSKTDIGLFLDFGNVWNVDYNNNIDSNKIRSSVGANVGWLSPAGPMSFVFSQNLSKASTDVTESFSFRLGTTF